MDGYLRWRQQQKKTQFRLEELAGDCELQLTLLFLHVSATAMETRKVIEHLFLCVVSSNSMVSPPTASHSQYLYSHFRPMS
jgi:hypothetical protein